MTLPHPGRWPALVLAAGRSTRMGSPKALLPFDGSDFINTVISRITAVGYGPVVVVAGIHAEPIRGAIPGVIPMVINPDPDRGMLSSVQVGLASEAARVADPVGVLICLVDHPGVRIHTYDEMAQALLEGRGVVIRPTYQGKHGHPILLAGSLRPRLMELDPARELRVIVTENVHRAHDLLVNDPGTRYDVDTPEDYARLLEEVRE